MSPEKLNKQALAALDSGNPGAALDLLSAAVKADPANPFLFHNIGRAFLALQRFEQASDAFGIAGALDGKRADSFHLQSIAERNLGRWDKAVAAAVRAAELLPESAGANDNLGVTLWGKGDFEGGIRFLRHAVSLDPASAPSWHNLAGMLMMSSRVEEAVAAFHRALRLAPQDPRNHWHLSMALLKAGEWAEGWREYEWRWRAGWSGDQRRFAIPQWDGGEEPKTILLHGEQGFGDTIQFARYAPLVAARGHRVILEAQRELVPLFEYGFRGRGVEVVGRAPDFPGVSGLPEADAHCPVMSLPAIFGTTIDTVPPAPYLAADPGETALWRARFEKTLPPGPRVGLVWAGNPRPGAPLWTRMTDTRRSMRLSALAPLFAIPGIAFVSLQKGEGVLQIAETGLPCHDAGEDLRDFSDTAAALGALDLLICVDTSIAHLAGALGGEVWVLSRFDGCWRWLTDRDDTPWYPKLRLFRQDSDRSWEKVVRAVAEALRSRSPFRRA